MIVVFLLLIHLIVCIVLYILVRLSVLKCPKTIMPMVFLVPLWGLFVMLLLEFRTRDQKPEHTEVGIEKLKVNDFVHRSILVEENPAEERIVPLEEALLINDAATRRELIMDILYHDTGQYVDVLNKARMNDDVEVVHYATTAMVELQKDYEAELQRRRQAWEDNRESRSRSAAYLQTLEAYVDSGLLEGNMKRSRQLELQELLEYKLHKEDNSEEEELSLYHQYFETSLSLEDNETAASCADHVMEKWPQMENGYMMHIRLGIACRQRDRISRMLALIRERNIYLTPDARKTVEFWKDDNGRQNGMA